MKIIGVVLAAVLSATLCKAQENPIVIQGNTLGQSVKLNCEELAKQQKESHKFLHADKEDKTKDADRLAGCAQGNLEWHGITFKSGRIVKIEKHFSFYRNPRENELTEAQVLSDAMQKFGKPTSKEDVPMVNGYGAQWTNTTYIWQSPSGCVRLYFSRSFDANLTGVAILTASTNEEDAALQNKEAARKNALD